MTLKDVDPEQVKLIDLFAETLLKWTEIAAGDGFLDGFHAGLLALSKTDDPKRQAEMVEKKKDICLQKTKDLVSKFIMEAKKEAYDKGS